MEVTKTQSVSYFFQVETDAACQQRGVNGNRDANCPFIRDNLVDGTTFTLCSSLIHPHIMTHADGTILHTNAVPSSPNSIIICSVSSNNSDFKTQAVCVCLRRLLMCRHKCVFVPVSVCVLVWMCDGIRPMNLQNEICVWCLQSVSVSVCMCACVCTHCEWVYRL